MDSATDSKIRIRFKAVGNAPILKKKRYFIDKTLPLSVLKQFLIKQLRIDQTQQLFLYCQSSFAPNLDQKLGDLHDMFKETTTNDLIIDYSLTGAYG